MSIYNVQQKLGIDTNTIQQVSQEILKRASEKNAQYNNVNTSIVKETFKPSDIGLDLYKGNIDVNLAKQIALNNSGLQIQLNQQVLTSINYLNTQAAQDIQRKVDGKITIALNEGIGNTSKFENAPKFNSIVSLEVGKDKNGSAPSYNGELLFLKKENKKDDIIA